MKDFKQFLDIYSLDLFIVKLVLDILLFRPFYGIQRDLDIFHFRPFSRWKT